MDRFPIISAPGQQPITRRYIDSPTTLSIFNSNGKEIGFIDVLYCTGTNVDNLYSLDIRLNNASDYDIIKAGNYIRWVDENIYMIEVADLFKNNVYIMDICKGE